MLHTIIPMESWLRGRVPSRTQSVRLIGPPEPCCQPLRLVAVRGNRVYQLHQPAVVVGRHSDADLRLIEPDVSRFHCRFFCAGDDWEVEDLSSLNGTYVNGVEIQRQVLRQDDVVRIGDVIFQTDLGSPRGMAQVRQEEAQRSMRILHTIAALLPAQEESQRRRSA